MDENEWPEIYKELEAACLSGELDPNNDASVKMFIDKRLDQEITDDEAIYDDKMLDLYIEREEIRLKIRKEKKNKKYNTFHELLLKGEIKIDDPFAIDILCKKKITNKGISKCKECFNHVICPKRNEINRNKKNGFSGNINKELRKRTEIIETYSKIKKGGVTSESAKIDTLTKLKIKSPRTFDKYYKTRNMGILQALKSLLKK